MATAIPSELLADLRARFPVSTIVGETVRLIKAGKEFKGLCPFHEEDTPSFYVNDEKGFYHCFGCSAHGDVLKFLTDAKGMTLQEAVDQLLARAELPPSAELRTEQTEQPATDPGSAPTASDGTRPRKRGAGLIRSDTVTVRFDPTLNYLAELAARAQRRTKSSFIEWAVELALREVKVEGTQSPYDDDLKTIAHLAPVLWDVDEADRLANLAFNAPSLMTHEDQLVWKLIKENGLLWLGGYRPYGDCAWTWQVRQEGLRVDVLRDYWETFKAVAAGERPRSDLPTWAKHDPDTDVPF